MRVGAAINSVLRKFGFQINRVHQVPTDAEVYASHYGEAALHERPFYNVGSGSFRHPYWQNVDVPSEWYAADQRDNIDIVWDIATFAPVSIESGTAEAVYTSHTIEHLQNAHVRHLFAEAYRVLKPGGFMRVTCPDILLYFEAYRRNAPHLTLYPESTPRFSMQHLFLNEFASQLSELMRAGNPPGASSIRVCDQDVDHAFESMPFDTACDHFTQMCDYDLHRKAMGAHINWWHADKIGAFLEHAGFARMRRSAYGQSFCPAMRNTSFFDNTVPRFSVFVEAEK